MRRHLSRLQLLSTARNPGETVEKWDRTRLASFQIAWPHLHSLPFALSSSRVLSLSRRSSSYCVTTRYDVQTLCVNRSGKGSELKSSSASAIVVNFHRKRSRLPVVSVAYEIWVRKSPIVMSRLVRLTTGISGHSHTSR